jgi:hypothetical protein
MNLKPEVQIKFARLIYCGLWFFAFPFPIATLSAAPMLTRWAATVSPTNVLAEYPRPQMRRERWQNLNGLWNYAITADAQDPPATFTNQILVPFPLESSLSGVSRHLDGHSTLWYRRSFTVPTAWRGQRLLLHFGAVNWEARVYLNRRLISCHRGGYDAFACDLTSAANWSGSNELTVAVMNPPEGDQPRGKQSRSPEGIFYTPSSGIWQTVWLEPVPLVAIEELDLVPDLKTNAALRARVMANTLGEDFQVEISARFGQQEAGHGSGAPGTEIAVPLTICQTWSPSTPSLYDVEITLRRGEEKLDRVQSYFGLRQIRVGTDEFGQRRLLLNGEPLFELGVLDQGFWPDGLYTAPSDEALKFDLETAKSLGFNLVRKHVKVEPERWYYWADRLGLLVWQDMPSGNNTTEDGRRQFDAELQRMVEQHINHPCIVMWVLFNEGWGQGQCDTERLVRRLKILDPTRLVDDASGWTDMKVGDVVDLHSYPQPQVPRPEPYRASVLSEFGGFGLLNVDTNHSWSQQTWCYQTLPDAGQLGAHCCAALDRVWSMEEENGLAAAVYTQLADVETECDGFLTYDRAVLKVDAAAIKAASRRPLRLAEAHPLMLVPEAQQGAFSWSYTTNQPTAGWMQPDFQATDWRVGTGGFGTVGTHGAIVNTTWNTDDIWLRREFTLEPTFRPPAALLIHHDEDVEVYLNGVLAATANGFIERYAPFEIAPKARQALHAGRNLLAVHCHQTIGGQFIDVGLIAGPRDH